MGPVLQTSCSAALHACPHGYNLLRSPDHRKSFSRSLRNVSRGTDQQKWQCQVGQACNETPYTASKSYMQASTQQSVTAPIGLLLEAALTCLDMHSLQAQLHG